MLAGLLLPPAAAQTTGTVTLEVTANNGDRDTATPGLQVDEGDEVRFIATFHGKTTGAGLAVIPPPQGSASASDYELLGSVGGSTGISLLTTAHTDETADSGGNGYRIVDDTETEDDETIVFVVTSSGGSFGSAATADGSSFTLGTPSRVTVTIRANDQPDTAPAFAATVADQTYTAGSAITPLPLPTATGGNGALSYTLTPDVASAVPGLVFDDDARTLSGTPTTAAAAVTLTLTAADADANTASNDAASLTFSVVVQAAPADTAPAFAATVGAQTYTVGTAVNFQLPEAGGGEGALAYTLTPAADIPDGLRFTANTRTLRGTPTTAAAAVTLTLTAADADANTAAADTATLTFSVVVQAAPPPDTMPAFAATVPAQNYIVGNAVNLRLPEASGGNGALTYTLTPAADIPDGLAFTAATRTLSGTPTTVTAAVTLAYTATDADGDTATLMFSVAVRDATAAGGLDALNQAILPQVARAIADQPHGAIARRVATARAGGRSSLAGLAAAQLKSFATLANDGADSKGLFGASDFALPLSGDGDSTIGSVGVWGGGEHRSIGGESGARDWDGDVFGFHLGVDARLRPGVLGGLMVSWSEVELDTSDDSATPSKGDYALDLTSAHPYLNWRAGDVEMWASLGYGSGELAITDDGGKSSADVTLTTAGLGGSRHLLMRAETELRLKGELQQSRLEADAANDARFNAIGADASRLRVAVEALRPATTTAGGQLQPSLEAGLRYDGGDGKSGGGAEVGGGLRYHNAARGVTLEGHARALLAHSGDADDWGVSGTLQLAPGADNQGLSLSLTPAYGNTGGGAQSLWDNGLRDNPATDAPRARMDLNIGYGMARIHGGLLAPYSEMTFGEDARRYRLGVRWALGETLDLKLTGERRARVWLEGKVRF